MKIEIATAAPDPSFSHTLLVPLHRDGLAEALAALAVAAEIDADRLRHEFRGYRDAWRTLHPKRLPRLVLLGVGAQPAPAALRQALRRYVFEEKMFLEGGLAVDLLRWSNLAPGDAETARRRVAACVEGCLFGSADLGRFKTSAAVQGARESDSAGRRLDQLLLIVAPELEAEAREAARRSLIVAEAQLAAMRLVDAPSNRLTPQDLAQAAVDAGGRAGFQVQVMGREDIEGAGMGGLLAVNRGSSLPPTFSVLDYRPEAGSSAATVGLAGKGVTFDTGGVSLKPSQGLLQMKSDMAGAAAVIGAVEAAARLRLPLRVVAALPATDNKPDASAQNPGDVIETLAGLTVEVEDTDAEGRLILADALAYLADRHRPDVLIDLATLTGAVTVALGEHAAGLFSNDDQLARRLEQAGRAVDERVWRLPLWPDYDRQIESDVADLKNYGGRPAGAVTAARFLQRFTGGHPRWAHLDIAGVAFTESDFARARHATGFGVRLLAEYLSLFSKTA